MVKKIDIIEVGPRDGFQNLLKNGEKFCLPTEEKLQIIESLIDAGVKHMQITSFVSPKAIPQLSDAKAICAALVPKYPDLDLFALIPNYRGAQGAAEAGLKKVTNVISLSVSHNKANINRTHDESFDALAKIVNDFPQMEVCLDVATAFGCPFEGKYYDVEPLLAFEQRAYDIGIRTMNLCDTVGMADPKQVREFVTASKMKFPDVRFEVHIHDTRGMGVVNTLAAIETGCVDGRIRQHGDRGSGPHASRDGRGDRDRRRQDHFRGKGRIQGSRRKLFRREPPCGEAPAALHLLIHLNTMGVFESPGTP